VVDVVVGVLGVVAAVVVVVVVAVVDAFAVVVGTEAVGDRTEDAVDTFDKTDEDFVVACDGTTFDFVSFFFCSVLCFFLCFFSSLSLSCFLFLDFFSFLSFLCFFSFFFFSDSFFSFFFFFLLGFLFVVRERL